VRRNTKIYRYTILHAEVEPDDGKTYDIFVGEKVSKTEFIEDKK
jgi:hypothetical protein